MVKNKPVLIFITILIAVIIIAISVVVSVYNKNKPIIPDTSLEVISSSDMVKIKTAYEAEGKKQEFLELYKQIELAVANKLLDGSVTNTEQLNVAVENINKTLSSDDWSTLGVTSSNYWMGKWHLDSKGTVKFTFVKQELQPDWITDEDVKEIIVDIK